jgi:hypothetical protein
MTSQLAEKLSRGFIPGTLFIKSMRGITGYGKIHHKRQEVSGHDFSRAKMRLPMRFGFSR